MPRRLGIASPRPYLIVLLSALFWLACWSPADAVADTSAPVVSNFDFTPTTVELNSGAKDVTVSVHLTDATGANAPTVILNSDNTSQTLGFGTMTRTSGTAQDGTYQRTVTIPTTAAPGTWTVTLYPVSDTLGNDNGSFQDHPTKLTVNNTPPTPPATAPEAPTGVTATAGEGSATLSWTRPSDNGSPITAYTITSSVGGVSKTVTGADTLITTIGGLTNGTTYAFTVVATNDVGNSPASAPSNTVTPAGVPETVATPTATPGDHSAQVSWTKPSGDGSPVTGYTITAAPSGLTKTVTGSDTLSTAFTGLTNGTVYTFTVVATNAIGNSSASAPSNSVTPAGTPLRMRAPKAIVQGNKAIVKWTAAVANGSPITGYKVNISKGKDKILGAAARKFVFKTLKPGRYRVCLSAWNGIGTGTYSAWTSFRIR